MAHLQSILLEESDMGKVLRVRTPAMDSLRIPRVIEVCCNMLVFVSKFLSS